MASAARRQPYRQAVCLLRAVCILKVCARAEGGSTRAGPGAGEAGATHSAFAISRSLNFCTLPVEVFGSSVKTTWRGIL
jgi:hypothetical protein